MGTTVRKGFDRRAGRGAGVGVGFGARAGLAAPSQDKKSVHFLRQEGVAIDREQTPDAISEALASDLSEMQERQIKIDKNSNRSKSRNRYHRCTHTLHDN